MKLRSALLFQVLLKAQILLTEIPKENWDPNMRSISAKLLYQIIILGSQYNENLLVRRVIHSDLKLPNRKWFTVSRIMIISEEAMQLKDDKKKVDPKAKKVPGKDDKGAVAPGQGPVETKTVPKLVSGVEKNT